MNRARLNKALKNAYTRSLKTGEAIGVILFSIDRFRLVNSRFGYRFADKILAYINDAVQGTVGRAGYVARWSGDEFLCILPQSTPDHVATMARALSQKIETLIIPLDTHLVNVTASFGTACDCAAKIGSDQLLGQADEALYEAKQSGRNRIVSSANLTRRVFHMGGILETALREDRITPAYQPIVELATGKKVAEEALARIVTVDGQILNADSFIEAAGAFQLTHKIDWSMILNTLDRCTGKPNDIVHFVNISGDLLRHPQLLSELLKSTQSRFPRGDNTRRPLVIEITEREFLENMAFTRDCLQPFLDLGIRLALDDFGSGYSSFQYLADLPVSFVKLDGRLISRIHESKVHAIIQGVQTIANDLGLTTLAEYVETEQQVDLLRAIGIHWAQGHYFGAATVDDPSANQRREMSVNWAHGYYSPKGTPPRP